MTQISKLILASSSPRRLELLKQIGIVPDQIIPADIDEAQKKAEPANLYVKRLADEKASIIASQNAGYFVIGADTSVAVGTRILGKPADEAMARKYLTLLSGRRHRVLTGLCVIAPDGRKSVRVVETIVQFKLLSPRELDRYIQSNEWQGKAGAYAIQGLAECFVKSIRGSFSNIVGLPLYETSQILHGMGF